MILIHQRHRHTDRRTDDMQSQDRALHYSALRDKKSLRLRHHPQNSDTICHHIK